MAHGARRAVFATNALCRRDKGSNLATRSRVHVFLPQRVARLPPIVSLFLDATSREIASMVSPRLLQKAFVITPSCSRSFHRSYCVSVPSFVLTPWCLADRARGSLFQASRRPAARRSAPDDRRCCSRSHVAPPRRERATRRGRGQLTGDELGAEADAGIRVGGGSPSSSQPHPHAEHVDDGSG